MSTSLQRWSPWSSWSPCSPRPPCRVKPTFHILLLLRVNSVGFGGKVTKVTKATTPGRDVMLLGHLGRRVRDVPGRGHPRSIPVNILQLKT